MTAVAFAPAIEPFTRDPLPRDLMIRFDGRGMVQWMNPAARKLLGNRETVAEALNSRDPISMFRSFPLGADWLWLGALSCDSGRTLAARVGRANRCLLGMCGQLGRRNHDLLQVRHRVYQQAHRETHLDVLRKAGMDFVEAVEAERGRIARELHDNAGQSLAGILLNLEVLERQLGAAGTEVLVRLERSRELAGMTLDQIRRISHRLNPPEWSDQDFAAAVGWLVESMGLRTRLQVEIGELQVPRDLSPALQTILYRTLQEGLTNVLHHSGARRVRIDAPLAARGVGLVLEDDGKGFDLSRLRTGRGGIGLANIRHRVEALGGEFSIESAPGKGTRLSVRVPVIKG